MDLHMEPIDLRMASVREARNAERRFCLEVITPHFTRVYQATSEDDMRSWISAVNNALQSAFESKGLSEYVPTESLSGSTRRDIASVLTGKSSSLSSHRASYQSYTSSSPRAPSRHATVGDRPSIRSSNSEDASSKLLQQVRAADAGNLQCADCSSASKVEWVSINLGIVLCIECSGIHRSLGTHISKVRSLTLDTVSFTQDIVELLMLIGNRVSNIVWEATLGPNVKPTPMSSREDRLRFITAKYSEQSYVAPISAALSHFSTPVETLLTSIKKNDIKNVLYALALKANPNSSDLSRGTHAVFLALAAADPASPASSLANALPSSKSSASSQYSSTKSNRKSFPIAELLIQNGAEIPSCPAPIPLSASARSYLDHKTAQRDGSSRPAHDSKQPQHQHQHPYESSNMESPPSSRIYPPSIKSANSNATTATSSTTTAKPSFDDSKHITALPSIISHGISDNPTSSTTDRTKEKKLTKRIGSGAKLVRSGMAGVTAGVAGTGDHLHPHGNEK